MKRYTFTLSIPYDELMLYYSGQVHRVFVYTEQGVSIELEALHFRSYIDSSGIQGRFQLFTDDNNKFLSLEKV